MTFRAAIISLLLLGTVAADEIRIDWRNTDTGNFAPINLTTTPEYVITFDADGNPVIGPAAAGVEDGDKGDITVSGTGAAWAVDAGVISLAKMANLAQAKLIGRWTASTGVPEAITIGPDFLTTGGTLTLANTYLISGGAGTFTDITATGTVNLSAATVTLGTLATLPVTSIELGHATANTLTASSGDLSIEGVVLAKRTGGNTFTGTQVFPSGQALIAPALGTIASGVGTALTALNGENIQDDTIDDDSIDFGTGTDQVSAADIPIADTGTIFTATDIEAALLELAKVPTKIHSAGGSYTVGTTDPRELYGGVVYVSVAGTVVAPAVAAGASFTVITIGAIAVSVDVNAADLTYLNGTALSDGDKITNASTAGDMAVFTYYDATGWHAATNSGWTDTN